MRSVIFILTTFLLLYSFSYPAFGQANLSVSANNAVLLEQSSGRILYEKNAHETQRIASITKIMTAIIAIESGKMGETTRASRRAIYTEGSSIYLEQGEKMLIEDLVYGLMLRSGNDAAIAISEHIGGSVEGFVYLMNEKARWLGLTNTQFDNPHGLDSEDHFSTAYDMALLMRYAMGNAEFRKITGTTTHQARTRSYAWGNKNKLLTSLYENCTGGKTGFTKRSGRTLTTSAHKDNLDLIAVTLNAPDDWHDHIRMYEWGFANYKQTLIHEKGKARYQIDNSAENITGFIHHDKYYPLTEFERLAINKQFIRLQSDNKSEQNHIGKTIFYIESTPILETPVFAKGNKNRNDSFALEILHYFKQIIGQH